MATIENTYWLKDGLSGDKTSGAVNQTERVIIEFDEVVDNVEDAIESSGFKEGEPHRNKPFTLFLNDDISAEVVGDDTGISWEFSLNYSSKTSGGSNSTDEDEYYIPEVSFSKWAYQVVVDRDKVSGDALLDPAGFPIDPLPVESISSATLSITVKENSPNLGRISDIGSINSNQVKIAGVTIPKYCGMLDDYQPTPFRETEDVISFLNKYTFKLKFFKNKAGKQIGFKLENLNAGFNYLVGTTPFEFKVKSLPDPEAAESGTNVAVWEPVATPQLLNADGTEATTPSYTEFVVNDVVNFSQYGLPSSYPVS